MKIHPDNLIFPDDELEARYVAWYESGKGEGLTFGEAIDRGVIFKNLS